jgi:hypothetical protein
MDDDDIEEIEILSDADHDVAATRQVIKVTAVERTSEIDSDDVLEAVDIVLASAPPAPPAPPAGHAVVAYGDDDDAYLAAADAPSTAGMTFDLCDQLEPEPPELPAVPDERRRLLGWFVGTVVAAAAALVVGAIAAEHFPRGPERAEATASPASPASPPAVRPTAAATPAQAAASLPASLPTIAVASLPTAMLGTIVGPARRSMVVDGTREPSSRAVVTCGKHLVQLGRSKKPRTVDVPCGGEISVR